MKKFLALILLAPCILSLAACARRGEAASGKLSGKLSIVSTIFPSYDFADQICGGKAEVTLLLPPGAESHSYEPSAKDIIKIQNCGLFIYVGGESESWVGSLLASMDKPVWTLKLMDCVNAVTEEIPEGMEAAGEEAELDEHVWTSPRNAIRIAEAIRDAVCEIDEQNRDEYKSNAAGYIEKLDRLDGEFSDFFAGIPNKTLVFGDRFPFRYFADAYGLQCHAAFPGCASETEASAATVKLLIDKVKAENISTVFHIEFSNHKTADIIAEAAGAKTALLHTAHNVTKDELQSGTTYISIMEKNLETLKGAMS